jgi:hypothetical protein
MGFAIATKAPWDRRGASSAERYDDNTSAVRRVLAGDADAFAGIVNRWQGPIEFPWARFLPGFFTCLGLISATFIILGWTGGAGMNADSQGWIDAITTPLGQALGLTAAAILGSLVVGAMAFRSGGRGGVSPTI